MQDLLRDLVPQARAVDSQLANDAALLQRAVAENDVVDGRRNDDLHQDEGLPVGFRQGLKEGRDGGAIDVVPPAFALGLQDVALALFGVGGELASFEAGWGVV